MKKFSYCLCFLLLSLISCSSGAPSATLSPIQASPSETPPPSTSSPTWTPIASTTLAPTDAPTVEPSPPPLTETSPPDTATLQLFDYDPSAPLEVEIAETLSEPGFSEPGLTLYDFTYASPKGGRVPAYLVVPDGTGPFAGIILMHGSSGSRESNLDFGKDLARTGAVSLLISAPSGRPQPNARPWINFTDRDRTDQIQLIVDLRRAVDVLIARPEVDAERLAYIGYSYGAAMGGLLAGVEHRIKAYGLMVGDGGLVTHFTDGAAPLGPLRDLSTTQRDSWLSAMEPIEPIHFVGQAAPSALFFLNARFDQSVTEADALAYQAAGSEPKRIEWYDSGHGLPRQAYLDLVEWLADLIGIDATNFEGPA